MTLCRHLGSVLLEKRLTLGVAESCTGGMVGAAITAIPGSSRYFKGGIIAYENKVKQRLLGVPRHVLDKHGAVSAETVIAMARGAQQVLHADCAIAVSGIAGPGGGTRAKPAGLVYIGIAKGKKARAFEERFRGPRSRVREQAVLRALRRMVDLL